MRTFPNTFSDILTIPHPWPKKGDRLLRESKNLALSASFPPCQAMRKVFIWDGYMTAGAALIDEAERRPIDLDVLVYPILFNYRHGLEVAMKWIIEQYGGLAAVSLDKANIDHELWDLWKLCEKILTIDINSENETEALRTVEQIIKDFHDIDKNSQSFRYSNYKNGEIIRLTDKPIDLGNVQRVMEAVNNFFRGADGMLNSLDPAIEGRKL